MTTEKTSVVIVGAGTSSSLARRKEISKNGLTFPPVGIYGMSTALWMMEDGGYEVTIVDRCETLPALDAASTGEYRLHQSQRTNDNE